MYTSYVYQDVLHCITALQNQTYPSPCYVMLGVIFWVLYPSGRVACGLAPSAYYLLAIPCVLRFVYTRVFPRYLPG